MKCRICAKECPPGAKLCRDCAAARKRAFAATVTQPLLAAAGASSIGQPRFAPRPAKPRPVRRTPAAATAARSEAAIAASAADASVTPRRLPLRWFWLGLGVALAIVLLLIRLLASNHAQPSSDPTLPGQGASEVASPATDATSAAAPRPLEPLQQTPAGAMGAAVTPSGSAADAGAALKSAAPKIRARKAPAKVDIAQPVEPVPAPKVEPAPAPRSAAPLAAPSRDPWQAMNEGLSRCAREDWFGRATCEQRLRLQYCPNYWGLVPQCPIGPTDHGS